MKQKRIDLPSGSISYVDDGQGPAVVLLHGGGLDNAELSWGHLIPTIAKDFRVIAPNWPGYGGSPWTGNTYTTDDLVYCLGQLLDHLSIPSAHIVGISMGGGAALGFALSDPHRVNSLTLVGSYGLQSHAPMHKLSYLVVRTPGLITLSWHLLRLSRTLTRMALKKIVRDPRAITDELIAKCQDSVQAPDAGQAFHAWQRSEVLWDRLRTCYMNQLRNLPVPTLLIHGEEDPLVPISAVQQAAKALTNATLHIQKDMGHWPQRENPDKFLSLFYEHISA